MPYYKRSGGGGYSRSSGGYSRSGRSGRGNGGYYSSSRGGTCKAAVRTKASAVAKSKLYTSSGERIRNLAAYQAAGGRAYSSSGSVIHNTKAYTAAIEASVRQNTNDPKYFYHYTDRRSAHQIAQSGKIKASHEGAVGKGTYLTTKPPRCSNSSLLQNNYGDGFGSSDKVQSVVKLDADRVTAKNFSSEMDRNVWKTRGDVDLAKSGAQIKDR